MGIYSSWINYITDPSEVQAEVMQAFQALDAVIDQLYQSQYIKFSYNVFYPTTVQTVSAALQEIGDALDSASKHLVVIPSRDEPLVDASKIVEVLCHQDGTLGLGRIYLATPPLVTDATIQVTRNGSVVYTITFAQGETGPKELDLSFISVAAGDRLGLYCVVGSNATGLMATVEY